MGRIGEKLDQHKQALKALSKVFYGSVHEVVLEVKIKDGMVDWD